MFVHHIALTVADLERSIAFYCSNFGFKEKTRFVRADLGGSACMLELKGFIIELWQFDAPVQAHSDISSMKSIGIRHFAFSVNGLQAICERLRANGLVVNATQRGATGSQYVFISDPDGIQIELIELPNNF